MKRLITAAWFISLFACQVFAGELQHSRASRFTGVEKVQASMHPGPASGCAKGIALSIRRKFPMAVKLSFLMQHVWR